MLLLRRSFVSLVLAVSLFALEEKVEIIAKNVDTKDEIVTATGSPVVTGKGYYIKADRIVYDKKNGILEAFGNVYALKDSSYIMSEYAKIYLNDKSATFDKFFMQSQTDDIWVSSKSASVQKRFYDVNNSSITSSCSVENPEWQIKYDRGVFDNEEKTMTLKNATFYAGSWPLLYSPYISFSTDRTRRSGILKPEFGYKADEGVVFAQPIYFVPSPDANWDSETIPQIRTTRGYGVFETFRFVDSPYSKGSFVFGYFKDSDSFSQKQSLRYSSHYGYSLMYDRRKLFAQEINGEQDGLYIDVNYLNDIDYKNLQDFNKNSTKLNLEAIATSKINYFYQKDQNYFGSYLRYYFDTSKNSNDDTIQQMPKVQYHRSLNNLYGDNLLYSADVKATRYDRKVGLIANQYQGYIPLSINFSFFDGYLGATLSENLYANKVTFGNSSGVNYNDYSYSSNTHNLKLYTTLLRPYESFIHTMDIEGSYVKPGAKIEKNYPGTTNDLTSQVTSQSEIEGSSFKLVQFFYDKKGSQLLSHRLLQSVYTDAKRVDYKYSDLENEVSVKFNDEITLSTDVFYSYKNSGISRATTTVAYKDEEQNYLSLSQTYKDITQDPLYNIKEDKANYLSFAFGKPFAYKYYTFGSYDYDYYLKEERSWGLGVGMKKRCFNYQVSLKKETTPILTSTNSSSVKNFVLYFSVNFVPIGGINQIYSVK